MRKSSLKNLNTDDGVVEIGDTVMVHDVQDNFIGKGKFLGAQNVKDLPWEDILIKMPDGKILHGCECWWIAEKFLEEDVIAAVVNSGKGNS